MAKRKEIESEMSKESGITDEIGGTGVGGTGVSPVINERTTARVKWHGPGAIAIGGVGELQPGQTVTVNYSMALDLSRAAGFTMEE